MEKTRAKTKIGWFIIGFIIAAIVAFILWSTVLGVKPKIFCDFTTEGEIGTEEGGFVGACKCVTIERDGTTNVIFDDPHSDESSCNLVDGVFRGLGFKEGFIQPENMQ